MRDEIRYKDILTEKEKKDCGRICAIESIYEEIQDSGGIDFLPI
jgi:hypothetical protein